MNLPHFEIIAQWEISSKYLELFGALIVACLTAIITHYRTKRHESSSQFAVFMKESSNFRDELRVERLELKKQLNLITNEREALAKKITEYEAEQIICEEKIVALQEALNAANIKIEQLHEKVRQLKEIQLLIREQT